MKTSLLRASLFVVITFSIFTVFCGLLIYKNALGLLEAWSRSNRMTVYLKIESTEQDKNEIARFLETLPHVASVSLIDKAQAGLSFQSALKEFSTGLITENEMLDLIPESFEIDLDSTLTSDQREVVFSEIQEQLQNFSSIDEISYSGIWLKKFDSLKKVVNSAGLFVLILVLVTFAYLISLMSQVLVENSKSEIEVYSLLGATRWSIYNHFIKSVLGFIVFSLALAYSGAFGFYLFVKSYFNSGGFSTIISSNLRFLPIKESAFLISALLIVILFSVYLTIRSSVNRLTQLSYD